MTRRAQGIRDNIGLMVWLAVSVPLFWWAPRAPEAPAVTTLERSVEARGQELARRDAIAWNAIHGDRRLPWDEAKGHLSIVIDDVGREIIYTERLLALPFQLTFSIVPGGIFADGVQVRATQDRRRYRELMLHLPMEPLTRGMMESGPEALEDFLLHSDTEAQLQAKTTRAFERVPAAHGFNNHMGSRLTANGDAMRAVMSAAAAAGAQFFLDSRTTAETKAEEAARGRGLFSGSRDIFLDHDPSSAAIRQALVRAVERAKQEPTVVIAHPSAAVVAALETGLPEAFAHGVTVYPLFELLAHEHQEARKESADPEGLAGQSPGMRENDEQRFLE